MVITHLLEGGEQLDADEAHLVAPDVFEQEGVMLQVVVRQVVLNLGHQLLDQLLVRGLPAVLLQLPTARARSAGVYVCAREEGIIVALHCINSSL